MHRMDVIKSRKSEGAQVADSGHHVGSMVDLYARHGLRCSSSFSGSVPIKFEIRARQQLEQSRSVHVEEAQARQHVS